MNCAPVSLRRPGFTLVELLVVISIIAILFALVVPAVNSARQKAATVKCQAQLREWGTAVSSYVGDSGGLYPTGLWYRTLAPYVGLQRMWEPGGATPRPGDKTIYSCPSASMADFGGSQLKISYAMNNLIDVPGRNSGALGVPTLRRSSLAQPGVFPVLFDARSASAYGAAADVYKRHSRTNLANVLFADGSVLSVTNSAGMEKKVFRWDPVDAM